MIHEVHPPRRILMGPGPSNVHDRVYRAMSMPMVGHLDPEFVKIMDDVKHMVRQTFSTKNEVSFVVSAPGSAGMETCLVNLLEPGDTAVICIHGVFGARMADIAGRCGARVVEVHAPWGEAIDPDELRKAVSENRPKLIAIVHAETSTGVLQPMEEISSIAKDYEALLVVDAVTSYCGTAVKVDDWGVDAIYSGTQKCLSAPPGLSPVSFSPRAVQIIQNRKAKVQSWFLDVSMVINYWAGNNRAYHHTAPVSSLYAIREAYRIVLEEGLENRYRRHRKNHEILRDELATIGIDYLVDPSIRLPMLNAVKIPEGVDDLSVRRALLDNYNIEIGGGLGKFAGKVWRIGLMGESSDINHINALISALKKLLS